MSRRVLILVENLPARRDPRVWRECRALVEAGYGVSVIAPRAPGDPRILEVDGVRVHGYRPPPPARGAAGFVREYAWSLAAMAVRSVEVALTDGFGVVQACNPPDLLFLVAAPYRWLGRPFVFDHHDLAPEVFEARFGRRGPLHRWLQRTERLTFRSADHVIATNDSYREVAVGRGGVRPERVTVVRNGPDLDAMALPPPAPELRRGADHLCLWFGTMGPQDGVDLALRAAADLVHRRGRGDVHFAFVGQGDARHDMQVLAKELGIERWVEFPGWLEWEDVLRYFATADVGLSPDPSGPLNDVSTMNKTMEYMAAGLPVVAFDLLETRVSAGAAACYARPDDPVEFAGHVAALLDDPDRRARMGAVGRARIEDELAWHHQRDRYVGVYRSLLGRRVRRQRGPALALKRILDVALAGALAVLLAPVLAVAALAIKLESRGPVWYRGIRLGRDGRPFQVLKLRSMRADADDGVHRELVTALLRPAPDGGPDGSDDAGTGEGVDCGEPPVFKVEADDRVTRVGRFLRRTSIDELGQLWNVLRGEMSLVGPRPEVPYALDAYEPWHHERFAVLPGLTGLWQVSGRSRLSPRRMLELDVDYAREWSLRGDLRILARTIPVVLARAGSE